MSDTPRTEKVMEDHGASTYQLLKLCRTLECELAQAVTERDEARVLVAEGWPHLDKAMKELEKAERERDEAIERANKGVTVGAGGDVP